MTIVEQTRAALQGIDAQERNLSTRVALVAALLAERFQNPEAAAYGRSQNGGRYCGGRYIIAPSTKRREHFWFSVGCALTSAYIRRGIPTNYERAVRLEIDAVRTAITRRGEQSTSAGGQA
jgi:hypothetical protein